VPRRDEPIAVQLIGEGFVEMLSARDISEGGLAVAIHHAVDAATLVDEVQVIISLPGLLSFSAKAQVRHISVAAKTFGVEFTSIRPEDLQTIEKYVARRVAEGGTAE
jgi:c-di-GMP-binding flagellar brake protein YcgR